MELARHGVRLQPRREAGALHARRSLVRALPRLRLRRRVARGIGAGAASAMSVRELLETGGLRAAASWLLQEHRADLSGAPEILQVLETAGSAADVRPLASVVAAYLLLSGDHDAARRAYSLGLGREAQGRVLDSCE